MVLAQTPRMHSASTQSSSTTDTDSPVSITDDWTCPFCPLLCDDIAAHIDTRDAVSAPDVDCPRLRAALIQCGVGDSGALPSIDGNAVDLDAALSRAADLLAQSRRPLFSGLCMDIAAARALYPLAAACGAVLDHLHGDTLAASTLALQDRGAFFTTLSEARSRADLIIVIGCRPSARYPRVYERLFSGNGQKRKVCFVGCETDPAISTSHISQASQPSHASTECETLATHANLFDLLASWSMLLDGRRVDKLIEPELVRLNAAIDAARYTAFVYEPATFPGSQAALLIEALNRIIKAVNRTTRAGGLALGGDDGALSVNQTITWLSGFPLRTRVARAARPADQPPLEYDPYRYATARMLAAHESDALLWVSSFGAQPLPSSLDADVPAIILGHPAMSAGASGGRAAPTVYIPVATPGVDSDGHLFRLDASVVAPLRAARATALPTVARVAALLAGRVESALRGPQ
ncbi:formylmethanofuran dehydrogenase [Paraburkholderia sp.]|uniref:formylmethanofuran dehydrogenase n=1 Tax=Paraburkholderia sp. TaxID=1926495 RepID=UPI002384B681|nr:formylmethanofuran dehydrogenase [Paraburkholderia sp.]MDE1179173.1 formylmethanofuran dehydrogenase [Paraburkholderia sp.]